MDDRKPRERESLSPRSSIAEHASDWIHLFSKQFEAHFIDSASSIYTVSSPDFPLTFR